MDLEKFALIDKAAMGDIDAAAYLAEGYLRGIYGCEKSPEKAMKWAKYAAKHDNEKAKFVLQQIALKMY